MVMNENLKKLIDEVATKKKGLVCREFEKICPTDLSFNREKKEMHDIFDDLTVEVAAIINKYFTFEAKE